MASCPKNNKAFTLIELMVVISIIAMLSSVILASLNNATGSASLAAKEESQASVNDSVADELVGQWTFDDASSPLTDTSGFNNNGTITGGATYLPTGGYNGKGAYSFDGSTGGISLGTTATILKINNALTVSAWVYPVSCGQTVIVRAGGGTDMMYGLFCNEFQNYYNGTQGETLALNLPLNQWSYVVAVRNIPHAAIYVNGKLVASASNWALEPNITASWIGIGSGQGNQFFNGTLDDVRIYAEAYTLSEVQKLYALEKATHENDFAMN